MIHIEKQPNKTWVATLVKPGREYAEPNNPHATAKRLEDAVAELIFRILHYPQPSFVATVGGKVYGVKFQKCLWHFKDDLCTAMVCWITRDSAIVCDGLLLSGLPTWMESRAAQRKLAFCSVLRKIESRDERRQFWQAFLTRFGPSGDPNQGNLRGVTTRQLRRELDRRSK